MQAKGSRKRVSLKTTDYNIAKERLRQHMVQLPVTKPITGSTFGSLLDTAYEKDLLKRQKRGEIKERSIEYKMACVDQIRETWPGFDLQELHSLTERQLSDWVTEHRGEYSATRTNGAITVIRDLFALAVREKIMAREFMEDISHGLSYVAVDYDFKRMTLALPDHAQVKKLRIQVYSQCFKSGTLGGYLFDFLLFSGVRIDSARHVKREDVHWDKDILYIGTAKTGDYTIPLFPDLKAVIRRIERNVPPPPPDPEHPEKHKLLLPTGSLQTVLTSACKAIGIPHLSHHDLRHIFATRCIESGVDIPTVAAWLGHKDGGRTAMMIYGHLRQTHSSAQAAKMKFI
jgi:integrase